jgi:hypothetical protein
MHQENARSFVLGFEAGEASEQLRILRLLEEKRKQYVDKHYIDGILEMDEVIALIKGESE